MSTDFIPYALTPGWAKTEIVLRFADATLDSNGDYRFTLVEPIRDMVQVDWVSCSTDLVGTLVNVRQFNNRGETSLNINSKK